MDDNESSPSPGYLALAGLGTDRPGLVAAVSRFLTDRGLNLEDSRMAVMGGEFGVLLLVSGPPDRLRVVERDLEELESQTGLAILTRPTESPEAHRRASVIPCTIVAHALDHEGIVHAVSSALHLAGVNIVSLQTTAYNAPITGSPLFRLEATIDVPNGLPVRQIRDAMTEVGKRENLDIDLRALGP